MKIACVNGHWHEITPTGLAVIVQAFIDGDLQRIGPTGVFALCLREAFTDKRVRDFEQRYAGNNISFDQRKEAQQAA